MLYPSDPHPSMLDKLFLAKLNQQTAPTKKCSTNSGLIVSGRPCAIFPVKLNYYHSDDKSAFGL